MEEFKFSVECTEKDDTPTIPCIPPSLVREDSMEPITITSPGIVKIFPTSRPTQDREEEYIVAEEEKNEIVSTPLEESLRYKEKSFHKVITGLLLGC